MPDRSAWQVAKAIAITMITPLTNEKRTFASRPQISHLTNRCHTFRHPNLPKQNKNKNKKTTNRSAHKQTNREKKRCQPAFAFWGLGIGTRFGNAVLMTPRRLAGRRRSSFIQEAADIRARFASPSNVLPRRDGSVPRYRADALHTHTFAHRHSACLQPPPGFSDRAYVCACVCECRL